MKTKLCTTLLGVAALFSTAAFADPPAGATAECKDGTYYTGTSHKGACKGHQGVKQWLDKSGGAAAPAGASGGTSNQTASGSIGKAKSKSGASTTSSKTKSTTAASAGDSAAAGSPPAGATAKCKDGTYYTGSSHSGACRGHQGVATWLDQSATGGAAKTSAPTPPASAPAPKPASTPTTPAAPASAAATPTPASQIQQKAGGGPGLVWVNSSSKVYHCQGDEWYGKTKEGSYMSEASAKAAGNRPAHGKDCGP